MIWSCDERTGDLVFRDPETEETIAFDQRLLRFARFVGLEHLYKLNPQITISSTVPKNLPAILRSIR